MIWRPDPSGPPTNTWNGGIILGSAPPSFERTRVAGQLRGERRDGRRVGFALPRDTQAARKSEPGGDDSSSVGAAVLREAAVVTLCRSLNQDSGTPRGGLHGIDQTACAEDATALSTRLRSDSLQRLSAMPAPARLTIASAPSISCAHDPVSPLGVHCA